MGFRSASMRGSWVQSGDDGDIRARPIPGLSRQAPALALYLTWFDYFCLGQKTGVSSRGETSTRDAPSGSPERFLVAVGTPKDAQQGDKNRNHGWAREQAERPVSGQSAGEAEEAQHRW